MHYVDLVYALCRIENQGSPRRCRHELLIVVFPPTFKTRSRHAFPIDILTQLPPKLLITKEVCSKSTSIVFPRIPYLVPALAQSFCMLHVVM